VRRGEERVSEGRRASEERKDGDMQEEAAGTVTLRKEWDGLERRWEREAEGLRVRLGVDWTRMGGRPGGTPF